MGTTWSPTTRILVVAVILLGLVWLAVMASPLLNALVISALLAYLLDPVVRLLTRRTRLKRSLVAVFVYLLFLLVLASIPATLGAVAVDQFRRLEADFAAAVDALGQWLFQPIDVLGYQLYPQTLLNNLEQFASDALTALPSGSLDVLSDVTTNLLWGLVILVSLYYFLKDGLRIKPWLVGFAPDEYQAEMRRLLDEVDKVWGVFLRVQLLIFVVLATLMAAGTFLVIWLFRTGLLELSPFGLILLLILIYAAVQQVDNLWLRPQLMGKQLRLHPGLVFVGLLGALSLSGVLGAIVVVPCMATVKVVGRYVHRKLLGLAPWPQEDMVAVGEKEQEDDVVDHGEPKPIDRVLESELSYFELQAYIGTTKHMGGFETTKELVELCHIDKDTCVLDVGCGVGATACYLAKKYGCRVVGVDLRESMVALSDERAHREGVTDRVEFRVADAQELAFDDAHFDVVLCESVATFIEDKQRVVSELARVVKLGGYVGFNEEIWLETPPAEIVSHVERAWEIKPDIPTADDWREMLKAAGLRDVVVQTYKLDARRESTQIKRYGFRDMWRMFSRTLSLYVRNSAFRAYMKERRRLPKGVFKYLGYGLFVGRR